MSLDGLSARNPSKTVDSYVITSTLDFISTSSIPIETSIRAALACTLVLDSDDKMYYFETEDGIIAGEVREIESIGSLLNSMETTKEEVSKGSMRLEYSQGPPITQLPPSQPLVLRVELLEIGSLTFKLYFDLKLLPKEKAIWFLRHLLRALNSILKLASSDTLAKIEYINEEELYLIESFARSLSPPSVYPSSCKTLQSFILNAAHDYPNLVALQYDDTSYTYSQLVHFSTEFAHHLIKLGVKRGTIVPLCISKSVEMIFSMLGILLAGAGYLCLEPTLPSARQEVSIQEVKSSDLLSRVCTVQEDQTEIWSHWKLFENLIEPVDFFRPLLATSCSTLPLPLSSNSILPESAEFDPAYVVFTSGSSGTPKGITITHSNVSAFLVNYRNVFGRAPGERVLQFPSYSFDVSVMNIWDTLAHGATICMTAQENILADLPGTILRLGCTVVDLTPTVSTLIFEFPDALPREGETTLEAWNRVGFKIKQCNTGGEKVEEWVRDAWSERGVGIVVDYGPSETTVGVISNQLTSTFNGILPIGRPTGNNTVYILSPSLAPVPLGIVGEIVVGGEQVSKGYLNVSLNQEVFVDHAKLGRIYRTGDLGRYIDEKGSIECLGRRDGQVKIHGLRIEVGEIEQSILARSTKISRAVVDKFQLESGSPSLLAFIALSSSSSVFPSLKTEDITAFPGSSSPEFNSLISELQQQLSSTLPTYMIPRYWIPVNKIPTQGMGKTDRKRLLALASSYDFNSNYSSRKSSKNQSGEGKEYSIVRALWSKLLRISQEDIDDEDVFTRLGGDSIAWMRFISLLRKEGYKIPYRALASKFTLSQTVGVLHTVSSNINSSAVQPYTSFSCISSPTLPIIFEELARKFSIPTSSIEDIFPTSPSQDSLLAASLDSTAYYAQAIYSVHSSLSTEILSKALKELVNWHPTLRTCFTVLDCMNETIQIVLKEESDQVKEVVDIAVIKSLSESEMKGGIEGWLKKDRGNHIFEWGRLAISFAIFEFGKIRKLSWSMHHAMSDGWTLELLATDLRSIVLDLPLEVRSSYTLFVSHWNHRLDRDLNFWSTYLQDSVPLPWPSNPNSLSNQFSTTEFSTRHWNGSFKSLAKYGITPAIASRIAIFVACGYHASFCDVTLGIVRSGRDVEVPFLDEAIGCFVSVLPSRLILSPSLSLLELTINEMEADRKSRENQLVTLGELARLQSGNREDLFNILFTYQSLAARDPQELETLPISNPPLQIQMPTGYALSIEVTPLRTQDAYEFTAYFDEKVLKLDEVEDFLATVGRVLCTLIDTPDIKISELDLGSSNLSASPKKIEAQKYNSESSLNSFQDEKEKVKIEKIIEKIWSVWISTLRLPQETVIDRTISFGSLGGDSIGMMRLSVRLKSIGIVIPLKDLVKLDNVHKQAMFVASHIS